MHEPAAALSSELFWHACKLAVSAGGILPSYPVGVAGFQAACNSFLTSMIASAFSRAGFRVWRLAYCCCCCSSSSRGSSQQSKPLDHACVVNWRLVSVTARSGNMLARCFRVLKGWSAVGSGSFPLGACLGLLRTSTLCCATQLELGLCICVSIIIITSHVCAALLNLTCMAPINLYRSLSSPSLLINSGIRRMYEWSCADKATHTLDKVLVQG